jgi:D-xylulose reductase
MKALVLEKQHVLSLRPFETDLSVGPHDVKIALHTVGICGSDVHYYEDGRIGPFVVREPMILGHEAAGTVVEVGRAVKHLAKGDRVCAEPGIPDPNSKASKLGIYNLDPAVRFWATPPVHGCLIGHVVHPAAYTYKLPDSVSFAEGAMVEPFAIGMQAAAKAKIRPGDVAVVIGAGTIGTMIALAALAGGCARVIVADLAKPKLDIAGQYPGITPLDVSRHNLAETVSRETAGWGADIVFEATGSQKVFPAMTELACPGGCIVLVGMPAAGTATVDIVGIQVKELRVESVFRYANIFDRAVEMIASGKVDLKPLVSGTFGFDDSVKAFERAAEHRPADVKLQIVLQ